MSSNGGSSGGSSSSSGGGGSTKVYDRATGTFVDASSASISAGVANKSLAPMPVSQSSAPRGAYLGTTANGASLTANADGTATAHGGSDGSTTNVQLPKPAPQESSPGSINYVPATVSTGQSSSKPPSNTAQLLYPQEGGGNGAIDTTVTQKPVGGGPAAPVDGPEGTTVTGGPRSDFSVVLAGQTGKRPERSAARSNNFVSLVGGAGGLGRKTSEAKRSLIGGA